MQIIETNQEQKIAAIRQCRYFASLENEILEELAEFTSLVSFERREIISWEEEPCSGLFIIHKGSVKLFKVSPQGRELIIRTYPEGTTFNEVPVFDGGTNPINTAALEDSELWLIEAQAIQDTMSRHPSMCKAVIQNLCKNLRSLVIVVEELSFYQVTNRLARLISQTPQDELEGENNNHLTQDHLAARLGTVREVVARSLRELERCGAIRVDRRKIMVTDERLLEVWSQGSSSNS